MVSLAHSFKKAISTTMFKNVLSVYCPLFVLTSEFHVYGMMNDRILKWIDWNIV